MDYRRADRPSLTSTGCSGAGREFQVPWCPHHQRTIMVQTHQDSREEGTTTPFALRRLIRFGMGPQILKKFYSCATESILTGCITGWYGNCSTSDCKVLQRVVRTSQYITGAKLPAILDLYTRQCQRKTPKIVKASSQPSHRLFSLLPHGKRYRSAKSRTKRLLNSFYPQDIRLLNNSSNGHRIIYIDPPSIHFFYIATTHCLLSMHSHFTYMYKLPWLTCTPAH